MKKQKWILWGYKSKYIWGIVVLLSSLFFVSCEEEREIIRRIASVDKIIGIEKTGNILFPVVWASWPNGCGRPSGNTIRQDGNTFYITMYGQQYSDEVCTQAFIRFTASAAIGGMSAGTYTFRFFQTDSTSLDTTITWDN